MSTVRTGAAQLNPSKWRIVSRRHGAEGYDPHNAELGGHLANRRRSSVFRVSHACSQSRPFTAKSYPAEFTPSQEAMNPKASEPPAGTVRL